MIARPNLSLRVQAKPDRGSTDQPWEGRLSRPLLLPSPASVTRGFWLAKWVGYARCSGPLDRVSCGLWPPRDCVRAAQTPLSQTHSSPCELLHSLRKIHSTSSGYCSSITATNLAKVVSRNHCNSFDRSLTFYSWSRGKRTPLCGHPRFARIHTPHRFEMRLTFRVERSCWLTVTQSIFSPSVNEFSIYQ